MRTLRLSILATVTAAMLFAHTARGREGQGLSDAEAAEGFISLFNGRGLTGWDGHEDFWSVKDGVIRGQTTEEKPTKGKTFLIYRGGPSNGVMKDFAVRLRYRMLSGNSGVQYRSFVKDPRKNKYRVAGYQAEIRNGPGWDGYLYDEARRGRLVYVGQITEASRDGEKLVKDVFGEVSDKDALVKAGYYRPKEWNDYEIVCRGNHIVHYVNGYQTIELIDKDTQQRTLEGLLALQIHAGAPMTVEFTDIRAKTFKHKYGGAVRLFNGTDLSGWTVKEGEQSSWGVKGGVMTDSGRPNGFICTDEDYTNFVLRVQVRHLAKANSGVLMRATELDKRWPRSIEAQCKSGSMGDIYRFNGFPIKTDAARSRGSLTRELHPSNEKPMGEWDQYEITLDGGDLELRVNGLLQNTATECEVVPGRVCLQSEGGPLEFRNIILIPIVE
ncbi:MAG: 3-keto-disaccharide hydrolase [Planctomycetota bacterium]